MQSIVRQVSSSQDTTVPGSVLYAALALALPYALKDAAITGPGTNGIVKGSR